MVRHNLESTADDEQQNQAVAQPDQPAHTPDGETARRAAPSEEQPPPPEEQVVPAVGPEQPEPSREPVR